MVKMDNDRIRRWKCLICGSKQKRRIDIKGNTGKLISYSLLCCNCGHLDTFALNTSAIDVVLCGNESKVGSVDMYCPLLLEDMSFCTNTKCKYRPKPEDTEETDKKSSVGVAPSELLSKERKYV